MRNIRRNITVTLSPLYSIVSTGVLVAIVLLAITGCESSTAAKPPQPRIDEQWLAPGLDSQGWPTFGHDNTHSGAYPFAATVPSLTGHITWQRAAGGPIFSSPVLAGGDLYVGSTGGSLLAMDSATGRIRWRHPVGQFLDDLTPVVVGRVVFVAANRSQVIALDRTTGQQLWAVDLHDALQAPPTYAEGLLLINTRTITYALDAHNGSTRWRFQEKGSGWPTQTAVTVQGELVYIAQGTTTVVYALALRTGATIWSHDVGDRLISTPLALGQNLVLGTWSGLLVDLDSANGTPRWSYNVNQALAPNSPQDGISGSPAADAGAIFIGTTGGNVIAVDAQSGQRRWAHTISGPVLGTPVVAGATLYISGGQTAYALSTSDGMPHWSLPLGDIRGELALGSGALYAGNVQGTIFAVN